MVKDDQLIAKMLLTGFSEEMIEKWLPILTEWPSIKGMDRAAKEEMKYDEVRIYFKDNVITNDLHFSRLNIVIDNQENFQIIDIHEG